MTAITISYGLTKTEILTSFLQGLRHSPKLLAIILTYSAGLGVILSSLSGSFSSPFTGVVLGDVLFFTLAVFLSSTFLVAVRGKTAERTLSVSPDGIATQIGSLKGQIAWRKVKAVTDMGNYVLVVGATGNAFFIPARAFSGPEHRAEFLQRIGRWRELE